MRVLDELEAPVLAERVKDALLTAFGTQEDAHWRALLAAFGSEDAAWEAVSDVTAFLETQPAPKTWLRRAARRYETPPGCAARCATWWMRRARSSWTRFLRCRPCATRCRPPLRA